MPYLHEDKNFHALLEKIHAEHGVDLTQYREKCLGRRIYSRLRATGVKSIEEYMHYLDQNPEEYHQLMDAVTINVTQFFRNAEVFEAIRKKVFPELIERKRKEGKKIIRLWSAGCASGEEPYTLGILLYEYLGDQINDFNIKIYGTDIDKKILAAAVEGRYEAAALTEVPPRLIQKYFYFDRGKYVISDKMRLVTKFLHHDLVKSDPINHVDLILCRNVVIYFSRELTHKVYASFYQSLNANGYLILGKVEALWGEVTRYFKAVDNRERIYQRIV
jgi:chemotaxis methyl-accepting protein methylase